MSSIQNSIQKLNNQFKELVVLGGHGYLVQNPKGEIEYLSFSNRVSRAYYQINGYIFSLNEVSRSLRDRIKEISVIDLNSTTLSVLSLSQKLLTHAIKKSALHNRPTAIYESECIDIKKMQVDLAKKLEQATKTPVIQTLLEHELVEEAYQLFREGFSCSQVPVPLLQKMATFPQAAEDKDFLLTLDMIGIPLEINSQEDLRVFIEHAISKKNNSALLKLISNPLFEALPREVIYELITSIDHISFPVVHWDILKRQAAHFYLQDRDRECHQQKENMGVGPTHLEILDDPLNENQKYKIQEWVQKNWNKNWVGADLAKLSSQEIEKMLNFFRVKNNPSLIARECGILEDHCLQVLALRKFIKASCLCPQSNIDSNNLYVRIMSSDYGNILPNRKAVSGKSLLKSLNDPIQTSSEKKNLDAWDKILARAHFFDETIFARFKDGNRNFSFDLEHHRLHREKIRAAYKNAILSLQQYPQLTPVIKALGKAVEKEKVSFYFDYWCRNTVLCPLRNFGSNGLYQGGRRKIFVGSLINHSTLSVDRITLSAFIHESLHMLFHKIVGNRSSPVLPNSQEEKKLDESIREDQMHRAILDKSKFSKYETEVWNSHVCRFEGHVHYFPNGFNPQDKKQMHTMRSEAIVRPMDYIARGFPEDAIKKILPNVWNFYIEHSQKLLEKYVQEG